MIAILEQSWWLQSSWVSHHKSIRTEAEIIYLNLIKVRLSRWDGSSVDVLVCRTVEMQETHLRLCFLHAIWHSSVGISVITDTEPICRTEEEKLCISLTQTDWVEWAARCMQTVYIYIKPWEHRLLSSNAIKGRWMNNFIVIITGGRQWVVPENKKDARNIENTPILTWNWIMMMTEWYLFDWI